MKGESSLSTTDEEGRTRTPFFLERIAFLTRAVQAPNSGFRVGNSFYEEGGRRFGGNLIAFKQLSLAAATFVGAEIIRSNRIFSGGTGWLKSSDEGIVIVRQLKLMDFTFVVYLELEESLT